MSWFYLALLAPVLYAVVNLIDDNLLHFVYKSAHLATAFAGFFGMLPLLSLLFLDATQISTLLAVISVSIGILMNIFLYFYFKSFEVESPAIVIALLGLAPALLPLFAYFLLNERLNGMELVGFGIVLLASVGLATPNFKEFKFTKALIPVLIAVVLTDVISLSAKYVYDNTAFYSAFMFISLGMGISGSVFYALSYKDNKKTVQNILKNIKRLLPVFIIAESVALTAEFTMNLAISRGPVSLVRVIENVQPIFVLLITLAMYPFAPKFFREAEDGNLRKKFGLMAIAVVGLAIISSASKA